MHTHNGNKGLFYSSAVGKVHELKDLKEFDLAIESSDQKILAVC